MDKILQQIYRDHRKQLQYPQHFIQPSRSVEIPNGKSGKNKTPRATSNNHSIQLEEYYQKKIQQQNNRKRIQNMGRLSSAQQETIMKYNRNYRPIPQKQLMFPSITNGNRSRNNSTKSDFQMTSRYSHKSRKYNEKSRSITRIDLIRLQRNKIKFRKCVNAIIFINKLSKKASVMRQRMQKVFNLSKNLLGIINKMINKHYTQVLGKSLIEFGDILKSKINRPQVDVTLRVVTNMVEITSKLKQSNIRKDLLIFLALVTTNNSPIPYDFFTYFQIQRLQFKRNRFYLKNMNQSRIKMVVGITMVIKICCDYMFKRPWQIQVLELTESSQTKIQGILWAYRSYLNCSILSYFKKLPKHDEDYIDILKSKGVKPKVNAKIDNQFFNGVLINYRKQYNQINENIKSWINRITHQVIKWQNQIDN